MEDLVLVCLVLIPNAFYLVIKKYKQVEFILEQNRSLNLHFSLSYMSILYSCSITALYVSYKVLHS